MTTVSKEEVEDLNLNTPLNFNNFVADDIDMQEITNVVMLVDNSSSMDVYTALLNDEVRLMIETWQKWHHAPKIFLSMGTFGEKIEVLTGFQPIANVKVPKLRPDEGSTKLYDGCLEFLKNLVKQQQDATKAGIQTKSIFCVLTDGADNASNYDSAKQIKKLIDYMMLDEGTRGSFGAVMCGIGNAQIFENAKTEMGFQKLFVVDPSKTEKENGKQIKAFFDWLSTSVSSVSSVPGAVINF